MTNQKSYNKFLKSVLIMFYSIYNNKVINFSIVSILITTRYYSIAKI